MLELDYKTIILITDGDVCDVEAALHQVMRANALPISIIIIGVGTEPMTLNRKLFNTAYLKKNAEGGMIRNFIKFVHLHDYVDSHMKFNAEAMVKAVFRDLPMQIVKFYQIRGIDPLVVD